MHLRSLAIAVICAVVTGALALVMAQQESTVPFSHDDFKPPSTPAVKLNDSHLEPSALTGAERQKLTKEFHSGIASQLQGAQLVSSTPLPFSSKDFKPARESKPVHLAAHGLSTSSLTESSKLSGIHNEFKARVSLGNASKLVKP